MSELYEYVKGEREKVYIYNRGNECIEKTGGWKLNKDRNSLSDITSYDYFFINSQEVSWRGCALTTNKAIRIDEYIKLKMLISKESAGQYNLLRFGIKTTPIENVAYNGFEAGDFFDEITYSGENIVIELDIENIKGDYYVGCDVDTTITKIYEIWFE